METQTKNDKALENLAASYNAQANNLLREKNGSASLACLGLLATPVIAYALSYVGEGFGWIGGHLVDIVPYARNVAPWLAERSGLVKDVQEITNFNVDFYQTCGAISGFWGGLWCGIKLTIIGAAED